MSEKKTILRNGMILLLSFLIMFAIHYYAEYTRQSIKASELAYKLVIVKTYTAFFVMMIGYIAIGFLATRLKFEKRAERYILGAGILALIVIFRFILKSFLEIIPWTAPIELFPLYFMIGIVLFSKNRNQI